MNKTSATAQAARHAIAALLAWMDAAPQPLSEWRERMFAQYRPLCHKALLVLDPQTETPLEKGILCSVSITVGEAADDEEWWEWRKFWQVELNLTDIRCTTHINRATIMGASQSYLFSCTDQEPTQELGQWELEFEAALAQSNVFVNIYER